MGADGLLNILLAERRDDYKGAAPVVGAAGAGQPRRRALRYREP